MSYTKIKNIFITKDNAVIFKCADSNIHPIAYYTYHSDWGTEQLRAGNRADVIGSICLEFLNGNFHSVDDQANRKFLYAIIINREKLNNLHDIIWNDFDWKTNTNKYSAEQKQQAKAELKQLLYQNYLHAEQLDDKYLGHKFVIRITCGFISRYASLIDTSKTIFSKIKTVQLTVEIMAKI